MDHDDRLFETTTNVQRAVQRTGNNALNGRLEEGTWADVTPIPAPLDLNAFRPAKRGVFAAVVQSATADASPRDWPSAMAAAAGPSRVLIADARGFTGEVLSLRPRGELS